MTYNEIIQKAGKKVKKHIYYIVDEETTNVSDESVERVKFDTQTPLVGTSISGCEITLKEPISGDIYVQIEAKYGSNTATETFGPFNLKEEPTYDANQKTYLHKCYDNMLKSMVDYEAVTINYPTTVLSYFQALVNKIGYTTNISNLPNGNRQMLSDIFNGIGYTYRDVLDDIAYANGVSFYIEENEIKIATLGGDTITINDDILKNKNIDFKEKYGPINSIVLSRSAESDNVYLKDDQSIEQNGLCEFKIVNNQLMNNNDRSDYLPALLSQLGGIQYYIYDTELVGYGKVRPLQSVTFETGNNIYNSYIFNNETVLTTGYKQAIYNDRPEQSETNYKSADLTDRKINQTYLIVDKQNQAIEGVVSQVDEQNEQIATIRLQYNELLSRISDIADITTSGESSYASVNLVEVNASQPISIKIHPINENISFLYPYSGLYPSSTLYPKSRKLRFTNTTTNEIFDWVLPTDLWYYDSTTYDELELSYGDGTNSTVTVTRKCKINADASISALATPTTETYAYPSNLLLTDGDYTISLVDNTTGYLFVQLMAKNIYTTQFYTKAETNSLISQTASSIDLSVDTKLSNYSTTTEMNSAITLKANEINSVVSTKVGNDEIISKINQTSEAITINANKLNLTGYITASDLSESGTTTINGANITTGTISADRVSGGTLTGTTISGNAITGGSINIANNFSVDTSGNMIANSGTFKGAVNTSQDLKVGNNAYIGQNQLSTADVQKYLYFATDAYIRRWLFSSGSYLQILSGYQLNLNCGSTYFQMFNDGYINCSRINAANIDKGKVWITPVANSPTSIHIDFNKTFTSAPTVVATPESAVIGTTLKGVSVANITTTGCDIYIYRTNTTSTCIHWIAMG